MKSRSFGLVFVMGAFLDKLRVYIQQMNTGQEDSRMGVNNPGIPLDHVLYPICRYL